MKYNVAVVGATGMVGRKMIEILAERNFPIGKIKFLASKNSKGKVLNFKGQDIVVEELTENSFKEIDFALFSAGGEISKKFSPIAAANGAVVIDNSSAFREDEDVPLIVPEVNALEALKHKGIIANPNCSTTQAVLPLKVLDDLFNVTKVIYTTYQAVSGSGVNGVKDLENTKKGLAPTTYPYSISDNCLPHIDVFMENGYTKEEMKMVKETQKILRKPNLKVSATCVRVPLMNSHAVNISCECEKAIDIQLYHKKLAETKGIVLSDNPRENIYPLAEVANGNDDVYVGRIRKNLASDNGILIYCVADNIRKGAATNTIQIAEALIRLSKGRV